MAVWTVHEHDRFEGRSAERAVFVRDGFSLVAAVVPPLWMLWHRMWLPFLLYMLVATAVPYALAQNVGEPIAQVAAVGLAVWFGFEARGIRRWSLARRGWRITGVAEGKRLRDAERRYFTARLAPARPAPSTTLPDLAALRT